MSPCGQVSIDATRCILGYVLDGTKTSRKNKRAKARSVYLMPEAVEALNRERKTYLEERLRF